MGPTKKYLIVPLPKRVLDLLADAQARHNQAVEAIVTTAVEGLNLLDGDYEFDPEMGALVHEIVEKDPSSVH